MTKKFRVLKKGQESGKLANIQIWLDEVKTQKE